MPIYPLRLAPTSFDGSRPVDVLNLARGSGAITRARDFRTFRNLRTIIYLLKGMRFPPHGMA